MTKETGGPAFPLSQVTVLAEDGKPNEYCQTGHLGLTVRDYFAAKAMQSFIAIEPNMPSLAVSIAAYNMADSMLKVRDQ